MERKDFTLLPPPRSLDLTGGAPSPVTAEPTRDAVSWARSLVEAPVETALSLGLRLELLELAEFAARFGARQPADFEPAEGYLLAVEGGQVALGSATLAGRRHGLRTLAQLVAGRTEPLPALDCADWPTLPVRGFMLCYHLVHDAMPVLAPNYASALETIELMASLKMNLLLFEPESMFPWKKHPQLRAPSAFTDDEIAGLRAACDRNGIEVVPLVQSIGHAYPVLRHREFSHLRELPDTSQQYCITNPDVVDFYDGLAAELVEAFEPRRFHLGGDESRRLGLCPRCAAAARDEGIGGVYADHVNRVAARLARRGLESMVWGDILEDHPDIHDKLGKGVAVVYWNYDALDWNRPYVLESYRRRGRQVFVGTAARFSHAGDATFPYKRAMRTNSLMAGEAVRNGLDGLIVTDWTKISPQEPGRIAMAYGAEASWAGPSSQEAFAWRWARLVWGLDLPELDHALDLVSELSLRKKDNLNPHMAPPFVDFTVHYMPDWLDRLDWSQWNFTQLLAWYAQQESAPQVRRQLAQGRDRAAEALVIFDEAWPRVAHAARTFGVTRLAAVVQHLKCRQGLALLDSLALLKFPRADDRGERDRLAAALRALVVEWDAARRLTRDLLVPATPEPMLERALALKFDPEARRAMTDFAALLEGEAALHGLYDREVW